MMCDREVAGDDIVIHDKCNERATSYSAPGGYEISAADMSDITLPPITFTYDGTLLAGRHKFAVSEFEAYAVTLSA